MSLRNLEVQRAWLSELRDNVETMTTRFSESPRSIAVLDTNVLLHRMLPSDVMSHEIIGPG